MYRLFPLRKAATLGLLLGVGTVPLFAAQSVPPAAVNFAVLAPHIALTQGQLTVNKSNGGGDVGALSYTNGGSLLLSGGNLHSGDAATVNALAAAAALDGENFNLALNTGDDLTDLDTVTGDGETDLSQVNLGFGAGVLPPGVYFVDEDARVSSTLTLSGAGEYIFGFRGVFTLAGGGSINMGGGGPDFMGTDTASPANVYFSAMGANLGNTSTFRGILTAGGNVNMTVLSNVDGKVLAYTPPSAGAESVLTVDADGPGPTVNDVTQAPVLNFSNPSLSGSPALSGSGTQDDPYVVTEGQTMSFNVTANDPEGEGESLISDSDEFPWDDGDGTAGNGEIEGYSDNLPLFPSAPGRPVQNSPVTYNPPVGGSNTGNVVGITYASQDADGATAIQTIFVYVNALPVTSGPSGVTGQAPFASGTGTAGDPFVACVGDTLEFDITGSDPANDGGPTTLSVTGDNASFTYTPDLPATENDDSVTTTVDFSPTAADGGTTFTLTFTTTDEVGATSTQDVVILVSSLPSFAAPFTEPGFQIVTACVGQTLQYDISAGDGDPGADVFLYADGTPVGAEHNPNFGGVDTGTFGDLLVAGGDPAVSRFEWTPMAGDEGVYLITYTAEDEWGCTQTTSVIIDVTNPPALTATSGGANVAEGSTLRVCPGQTLTVNALAVDPDLENVAITANGTPSLPGSFTSAAGPSPVTGTLSFTPTAGQANNVYTVTLTATDTTNASTIAAGTAGVSQCAANDTLTFTVVVEDMPTLTVTGLGTTVVNGSNVINACTGDAVKFRVTGADAGENVTLTQTGAPAAFLFTPSLPHTGINSSQTDVSWTAGAASSTVITFTATDAAGCATTATVTINVSNLPTLSITPSGGSALADGATVVACVGTPYVFTVAGNSGDAGEQVTLTQTGAPAGLTPSGNPLATGTPATSVVETFTPTAGQGGQTFTVTYTATDNSAAACSVTRTVKIRVSNLPVPTVSPSSTITVCEGMPINYRVRATDADPGNVTIGSPSVSQPEGQPSLVLTNTPSLPTAGNPVETVVTTMAPDVSADTTYTIIYPITDSDGCLVNQTVTVTVLNTVPTSVILTRTGGDADDPFGTEICYTAVVLDNCPVAQGGPRRIPGVQVCFNVVATTGNAGNFLGMTDANGEAKLCFTPLFPGTITTIAVIDQNGDCVADSGTTPSTPNNVTIPAPVQLGVGCFISGRGKVDVSDPVFGTEPVVAQFTIDISPKRNGGFKGQIASTIPNGGSKNGRRTNATFRTTVITSVECTEGAVGKTAIVFGLARVTGVEGLGGAPLPFRADILDAGTPGVPNDRFTMTLLDPVTFLPLGPVGGNLAFNRGRVPSKDDIKIRVGPRIP